MNTTRCVKKIEQYSVSQWLNAVQHTFAGMTSTNQNGAVVLLESPRQILFQPLSDGLTQEAVIAASSCIVCDARAEWRLEKKAGDDCGLARLLCEVDDTSGELSVSVCARRTRYLLRNDCTLLKNSRLAHVEYFIEDDNGMLVSYSSRLAGLV